MSFYKLLTDMGRYELWYLWLRLKSVCSLPSSLQEAKILVHVVILCPESHCLTLQVGTWKMTFQNKPSCR